MTEDDEFWLRGKDDLGNEYVFDLTSYDKPNLIFELQNWRILDHKAVNACSFIIFGNCRKNGFPTNRRNRKMHIEEIGTVYDEDQAPEDLAVPVGDGITVDLQN